MKPEIRFPVKRERATWITTVTRPDGSQKVLGYDWTARAAAVRLVDSRDEFYPWNVAQFEMKGGS